MSYGISGYYVIPYLVMLFSLYARLPLFLCLLLVTKMEVPMFRPRFDSHSSNTVSPVIPPPSKKAIAEASSFLAHALPQRSSDPAAAFAGADQLEFIQQAWLRFYHSFKESETTE